MTDTERIDWLSTGHNVEDVWRCQNQFYVSDSYGATNPFPTLREAIDAKIEKERKMKVKP